jgi:hypothetical protein
MATKVRKQIYIDPNQEVRLKQLAAVTGLTEAEIIRRAIDGHLAAASLPNRDLSVWQRESDFIQAWIAKGPVVGGRSWTREELYAP